jgi:hypothetical protein
VKPVDTVVAAKLVSVAINGSTFQGLAEALGISTSEAHEASNRLVKAGLFKMQERRVPFPIKRGLLEFWVHGLKYVYPAETGAPTRGLPTSVGAPPLAEHFSVEAGTVPVWPSAEGHVRGPALLPIHKSAVKAASDPRVYELLALLDALREGRVREHQMAETLLKERLYRWA